MLANHVKDLNQLSQTKNLKFILPPGLQKELKKSKVRLIPQTFQIDLKRQVKFKIDHHRQFNKQIEYIRGFNL